LSDKPTLQDLLEIQQHFGLPSPALVEKDWHVVKALAAIAAADTAPFRLVRQSLSQMTEGRVDGGTARCRCGGLYGDALPNP
jgi:hypothetical protein